MDFISALKLTKTKRPVVCPNLGFELQLKSYEKLLNTRIGMKQSILKTFELPELLDRKFNTNDQNRALIKQHLLHISKPKMVR